MELSSQQAVALFIGGRMSVQTVLPILQLVLTFGNICVLGYALFKFLNRPHNSLEERVNQHEVEIKEIKQSLLQGNDRFREQEDTNEILLRCTFALLEFEVHYCETEQKPISKNLEKAKDDLHSYLARK